MRLAHLSTKTAGEYFEKNDAVIIATGSIENHGSHTALGTDTLVPDKILEMIEDRLDILIAPTLPYGSCDSLMDFPGTVSLSDDIYYLVVKKIVDGLKKHGAKKFIFMNGHGGNIGVLKRVCLEINSEGGIGTIVNWWLHAWDLNPAWKGGHGGGEETSAVMAINPDFVDLDAVKEINPKQLTDHLKLDEYGSIKFKGITMTIPRTVKNLTDNGWFGIDHPSKASVKWGTEMLDATSEFILEYVNEFNKIEI